MVSLRRVGPGGTCEAAHKPGLRGNGWRRYVLALRLAKWRVCHVQPSLAARSIEMARERDRRDRDLEERGRERERERWYAVRRVRSAGTTRRRRGKMVSLLSSSLSSSHLSLSARATLPQLARYLADPFFIVPLLAYLLLCSIRCSHPASISLPFLGAPCLFRAPAVHSLHVHTLYYCLYSTHLSLSLSSSTLQANKLVREAKY